MDEDKLLELHRYDACALSQLSTSRVAPAVGEFGSGAMPQYLRTSYIFYENFVSELIGCYNQVLEFGAGSGLHTWSLVHSGAVVTATDISPNALKLLEQRIVNAGGAVVTQVADMECLPFEISSFDVIVRAGSLSYGDQQVVDGKSDAYCVQAAC